MLAIFKKKDGARIVSEIMCTMGRGRGGNQLEKGMERTEGRKTPMQREDFKNFPRELAEVDRLVLVVRFPQYVGREAGLFLNTKALVG